MTQTLGRVVKVQNFNANESNNSEYIKPKKYNDNASL